MNCSACDHPNADHVRIGRDEEETGEPIAVTERCGCGCVRELA